MEPSSPWAAIATRPDSALIASTPRQETPTNFAEIDRSLPKGRPFRRSWFRQRLLPMVAVSVLVVSACATDTNQEPANPRPLDEVLSQGWPPPSEEHLREIAESLRLDEPPQDVEFERYIYPDEYAAALVPCLTEQGVPASALPDGGIGFGDIPPEQARLQTEALYRCQVRFPVHPFFEQPLDDEQLRRLYDYLAEELTACLEAEGYATAPPPSAEIFIESYYDPQSATWSPYPIEDPRLDQEAEWYRLNEVCPQTPPLEVLYGG